MKINKKTGVVAANDLICLAGSKVERDPIMTPMTSDLLQMVLTLILIL